MRGYHLGRVNTVKSCGEMTRRRAPTIAAPGADAGPERPTEPPDSSDGEAAWNQIQWAQTSRRVGECPTAAFLKGYRTPWTPADTNRARGSDGRRPRSPIRLEGGNRGEVRDGAGVGLW